MHTDLTVKNSANVVVVGNQVYEASTFAPEVVQFTRQKYLFLHHFYSGIPLLEAALKVGMEPCDAEAFVATPKAVEWLQKRAIRDYIRQDWEGGGKWIEMGEKVLNGERRLSKDQQVVYMAFADRFFPKAKSDIGENVTVNFNFSAADVKEAFARERAYETEATST